MHHSLTVAGPRALQKLCATRREGTADAGRNCRRRDAAGGAAPASAQAKRQRALATSGLGAAAAVAHGEQGCDACRGAAPGGGHYRPAGRLGRACTSAHAASPARWRTRGARLGRVCAGATRRTAGGVQHRLDGQLRHAVCASAGCCAAGSADDVGRVRSSAAAGAASSAAGARQERHHGPFRPRRAAAAAACTARG